MTSGKQSSPCFGRVCSITVLMVCLLGGLVCPAVSAAATSVAYGRTLVDITEDGQVQDFVDAIATPNTTVRLADDINLDLSGRENLEIMPGVHIVGRRSSTRLGPRIFTTTQPAALLRIGFGYQYHYSDGVRITGIRLDGGDHGIADADAAGPIGVSVNSSVNVEIGNSEIYGWAGVGVQVLDDQNRISLQNPTAVRVHSNYIHHNRHWRKQGYGVKVASGAYALIEGNVFDYNRHAIEASNTDGIGYLAYSNLVLGNGGENCCSGAALQHTHQFDVHGTDKCGGREYYCGEAGEYFDYRHNDLIYTNGDALKVRGKPDIGADVAVNTFAACPSEAYIQTDGDNLKDHGNNETCRSTEMNNIHKAVCDFDADGRPDDFRASGRTWWFRSVTMQWSYLSTNHARNRSKGDKVLRFQDQDLDGRCEVIHSYTGEVYSGGRDRLLNQGSDVTARRSDLLWQPARGGSAESMRLDSGLNAVASVRAVPLPAGYHVEATGDFNADGYPDLLARNSAGQVRVDLMDYYARIIPPIGGRSPVKGMMPMSAQLAGVGDFNADGRSDVLWRLHTGQLVIWFAAEAGNSAKISWNNTVDANGSPADDPAPDLNWRVTGIGDFDGDGFSDVLWRHASGQVAIWFMVHGTHVGDAYPGGTDAGQQWEVQGIGDFDGDGRSDILWRQTEGALAIWNEGRYDIGLRPSYQNGTGVVGQDWSVRGIGDFNADGRADILWRHTDGAVSIWKMSGGKYLGESARLSVHNSQQFRGLTQTGVRQMTMQ